MAADGRDRYQRHEQRFQGFHDRTRAGQARQFRMDSIPTVRRLLPEQRGLNEMTVMAPTVHEAALCESNVITHPAYLIISNSMSKPVRIMTALTVMTAMNLALIGRIGPMRVRVNGLGNPPGRETAEGAGIPVAFKRRAGT